MDHASVNHDLTAYLTAHEPFCDLDPATLAELGQTLQFVRVPAGQTLFRQGDPGDSLYLLVSGRLSVHIAGEGGAVEVDRLEPGVTVGEMALLSGQARSATVNALEDAELIRVSAEAFDRLAGRYPDAVARFASGIAPRIHRTELVGVITRLFGELDTPALHSLQSELNWHTIQGGEVLFREGDKADCMYLVVHGRISVYRDDGQGQQRLIGEVVRGDVLGETGLLTGEPRSLTARAARDSIVASMSREAFDRVMGCHPRAIAEIARLALHRQRTAIAGADGSSRPDAVFALLPAARGAPVSRCAEQLAATLSHYGPVLHLTSGRFDARYGKTGLSQTPADHPMAPLLVAKLSEVEHEYSYVIYEADAEPTAWSKRCVRQVDRVLLVGEGARRPPQGTGPAEEVLRHCGEAARCELVLVQPADRACPSGTAAWLDRFPFVAEHHHVRLEVKEDWERAVRRLTGRALGLVLSGGGARGLAHIGVWRALREAGVTVDVFGGASMGAIVGALCAMGMSYDEVVAAAANLLTVSHLADPTLPIVSFLSTGRITAALRSIYGDVQIEDLWWPFYAMATNLSRAVQVVQRRGSLVHAVRASMAVPGIAAPVCQGHEIYVDGGVLNNIPVDVMHRLLRGGKIIAVNAWPEAELMRDYCFDDSISGWDTALDLLNPLNDKQSPPLIFELLLATLSVGGVANLPAFREFIDLYICPPVEQFSPLNFLNWKPVVEVGYRSARQALAGWAGASTGDCGGEAASPIPDADARAAAPRSEAERLARTLADLERVLERKAR